MGNENEVGLDFGFKVSYNLSLLRISQGKVENGVVTEGACEIVD